MEKNIIHSIKKIIAFGITSGAFVLLNGVLASVLVLASISLLHSIWFMDDTISSVLTFTVVEYVTSIHLFIITGSSLITEGLTAREIGHLYDVKGFVQSSLIIALIPILILIAISFFKKGKEVFLSKTLLQWYWWVTAFTMTVVGIGSIYFDVAFLSLHNLLFTNDWWQLYPENLLIQLFPQEFFMYLLKITLTAVLVFTIVNGYILMKYQKSQA